MSELQKLEMLSSDSVDELRLAVLSGRGLDVWAHDLDKLVSQMSLEVVDSEYELDVSVDLRLSDGVSAPRELDAANSRRLLKVLPNLTAADAIDERIWVTLALGRFRHYVLDRWPRSKTSIESHLNSHVFAASGRGRQRDHAIARLWWTGKYAERFAPDMLVPTLQALFSNSDIPVQLQAGRPNVSAIRPVAVCCLALLRGHFVTEDKPYPRDDFRDFMKEIDLLAGRRALGALSEEELMPVLEEAFARHVLRTL